MRRPALLLTTVAFLAGCAVGGDAAAQDEIADALDRRDDAAGRVNEAVAATSERWEQRPATPAPGGGEG